MKKRPKCELITVSEYDGKPLIDDGDTLHKYHKVKKGTKERYLKATRKTCSECGKTALYVGIFRYKTYNRVERFCRDHGAAAGQGELPFIPEIAFNVQKSVKI